MIVVDERDPTLRADERIGVPRRDLPHPAFNFVHVEDGRISVELRIPRGEGQSLGDYPDLVLVEVGLRRVGDDKR